MRRPGAWMLVAAWGWAAVAFGAPPDIRVSVGYGRLGTASQALPLRIEVGSPDTALRGRLEVPLRRDRLGIPHEIYSTPVDVPAGGHKPYWLTVWPGSYQAEIEVDLRLGRAGTWVVKEPVRMVESDVKLVAVVSPSRSGLRFLNGPLPELEPEMALGRHRGYGGARPERPGQGKPPAVRVVDLAVTELSPDFAAYRGLAALVLYGDDFTRAEREVKNAVEMWVRTGGQLFLVGGVASAGLWQDPVIDRLSPVGTAGTAFLGPDDFGSLIEHFGGELQAGSGRYAVTRATTLRRGTVVCRAGDLPLLVVAGYGKGQVSFLAAAYDEPPLDAWSGQEKLWRRLLGADHPVPPRADRGSPYWPLHNAAIRLPSVSTPSGMVVAAFLLAYLIVLVPLQFVVLKRLRRRELAWITTPLIVLCFSLGAYVVGRSAKGRSVLVHTVTLVDAADRQQYAPAASVTAVFSPAKQTYTFDLPPLCTRAVESSDRDQSYSYGSEDDSARGKVEIEQVPGKQRIVGLGIDMWALRAFSTLRWQDMGKGVEVRLRHTEGRLRGSLVNRLPTPVLRAVLMVNGASASLGDLAPGAAKPVDVPWRSAPPPAKPSSGPPGMRGGMPAPDPAQTAAADALVKALLPCPSKGFDADTVGAAVRDVIGATGAGQESFMSFAEDRRAAGGGDPGGTALWGWTDTVGGPLTPAGVRGQCQELTLLRVSFAPEQG